MKPSKPASIRLLLLLLALATIAAPARAEYAAAVIRQVGTVEVMYGGAGEWQPLQARTALHPGDHILVGTNSRAKLLFTNGTLLRLRANTEIVIRPPARGRHGAALIEILYGEVITRFSPTSSDRSVQTPTGVAGDRGTEIDVQVAADGTSTLVVIEGAADFFNEKGAVIVLAGQESVIRPGQGPTPPIAVNVPLIIQWSLDLESMLPPLDTILTPGSRADVEAASRRLALYVTTHPTDAQALLSLGAARHDVGDYAGALQAFEAAGNAGAPDAARLGTAQVELDTGRLEDAAAAFDAALAAAPQGSPAQVTALRGLALAAIGQNDFDTGTARAQQLAALPGQASVADTLLGQIDIRRGQRAQALTDLQAAVTADPTNAGARATLALLQLEQGRLPDALANARQAAQNVPASSLAHAALSQVLFYSADLPGAEREAKEAVSLNGFSSPAQLGLAQVSLNRGNVARAVEAALRAVALDPQSARAHFVAGVTLAEVRRDEQSVRELSEALRLNPDLVEAQAALARVYLDEGRKGLALTTAEEAVARHRDSAVALGALAEVQRSLGHLRLASDALEAALRITPDDALLQAEIAQAYLDENRLADALSHAQRAVALAPTAGHFYAILGLIYDRMQSGLTPTLVTGSQPTSEQAERAYREAIALYPEESLARVNLAFEQLSAQDQPNPDFYFGEIAQGLLQDPSVSSEIYRPGISAAIIPEVGNQTNSLSAFDRLEGKNGRLRGTTFFTGGRTEGALPNGQQDSGVLTGYYTLRPDDRTNLLADVRLDGLQEGQPGAIYQPTPGSNLSSSLGQVLLGARRELVPGYYLWLAVRYRNLRAGQDDPNAIADGTNALSSRLGDELSGVEARWDGQPIRPVRLSAGASFEAETLAFRQDFFDPPQQQTQQFFSSFSDSRLLGWTQAQADPTPWLTLTGGYRYQQITSGPNNPVLFVPGQPQPISAPLLRLGASGNFPYGMITIRPVQKVLIRLIAIQSQATGITPSLVPEEVFEIAEAPTVALFGRVDTREADVESQISAQDFLRVFSFTSRATNLPIGPDVTFSNVIPTFTIARAQLQGVGVRYERQITPLLSGYARWLFAHDTDESSAASAGNALPLSPNNSITTGLSYVDRAGFKVRLSGTYRGPMYQDRFWYGDPAFDPGVARPRSPGVWVTNLRIAREPGLRGETSLEITNLFNVNYALWPGLPAPGLGARLQYEWRF